MASIAQNLAMEQAVSDVMTLATTHSHWTRGPYKKFSDEERANIGCYAVQHGNSKAAKEYGINESTVRSIKRRYYEVASDAHCEDVITLLPKKKQGRTCILGELDGVVQDFIRSQRSIGAVITRSTVIGIGKGVVLSHNKFLLTEYGGNITLTKHWAESILHRMKYVKRRGSTKVHVLGDTFEKIKKKFLDDIKITVTMEDIPSSLIINWDQTAISIVPGSCWTMAPSGSRRVEIVGMGDKRQITAVFAGSLSGNFLPPQLIYTGKTPACHPKITFPPDWHITHTSNHWANEETMKDYVTKVIVPYVQKKRMELPSQMRQPALVIFDVFRGQMCQSTIDLLMADNIHFVRVPPNCTDRLQPLDTSVNKSCKDFMRNKFIEWYSLKVLEVMEQTEDQWPQIDLRLSTMKPLTGEWIILFYNYMLTNPEIIKNGFKSAGII
jgi:hypothetical protein